MKLLIPLAILLFTINIQASKAPAAPEKPASNPENLKASAAGDIVVSTFTQALAISVEKAPAK